MDGSDQSCSSPSPTRRSSVASKPSPSAENHLSNQKMGSNFQSPKKPATKKFSSPTKCATSKAIAPREKILAERNGVSEPIFSNTHSEKTQHFDSKATFVNHIGNSSHVSDFDDDEQNVFVADSSSQPYDPLTNYLSNTHSEKTQHFDSKATFVNHIGNSSHVSDFDDDEQNVFVADSSSQPYDPLTNYLSPRPKFLRYQPNRRRQILMSPRNEQGVGKYGLGTSISLCLDPQKATSEEATSLVSSSQEESSVKQEESSVKQEEEEIDESDKEIEEEWEEEERGNWVLRGLLKSFLVFVVLALCTSYTCSMKSQLPSSLALQAVWDIKDGYERVQDRLLEAVKNLEGCSGPFLGDGFEVGEMEEDVVNIGGVGDAAKNSDFEERESEVNLGFSQDQEAPTMSEEEDEVSGVAVSSDSEEAKAAENPDLEEAESEETRDVAVSSDSEEAKTAENPDLEEAESEETRDVAVSHDNEEDKVADNSDLEETESEEILGSCQDHETVPPMSEEEARDAAVSFDNEAKAAEISGLEETESEENLGFSEEKALMKQFEEEMVALEDDVKTIKERPFLSESSIMIGSALGMCTIVASLVMGFVHQHMKKKRATVATNDGSSDNTVARKEEEKEHQTAHLGSSKNETQISEVAAKDTPEEEELNHLSKAPPSIQMLSEFVVVEKKSMSISKCSDSVPVKARRPEMSEVSSNNSYQSYARRSLTAEKKMVKKSSSGKENVVMVEVATPVRRSSRIRSKSITSP